MSCLFWFLTSGALGTKFGGGTSWSFTNKTLKSFLKDGSTRNNNAGNSINGTWGVGVEIAATWDFSKTWIYNRTNSAKDAVIDIIKSSVPGIDWDLIQHLIKKDAGFLIL